MVIKLKHVGMTPDYTSAANCPTCTRCGKILRNQVAWLELNTETGDWSQEKGAVPDDQSQGWFPFGLACARRRLSKQGLLVKKIHEPGDDHPGLPRTQPEEK